MQPLSAERIAELRSSADGLGARNRVHQLTNDELVALLDSANERNQLALERDMARRERDGAKGLSEGAERELQEVREQLTNALGDPIASYLTTPGLARAAASRVADLTDRAKRTGKFAGPPSGALVCCGVDHVNAQGLGRHMRLHHPDAPAVEHALETDRAIAGMLRAILSSIGLAPTDSWIEGAAAGLAQLARHAGASPNTGHRVVLSTEDVETVAEALDDLVAATVRIVERSGGREFVPAHADMVERQTRLLEMFDRLLDDAEAAKAGGAS
jgi:hypothetical protein